MNKIFKRCIFAIIIAILIPFTAFFVWLAVDSAVTTVDMTVSNASEQYEISENLFGIFFEDISYSADGGLSSNQIKNNSFELKYVEMEKDDLSIALNGWQTSGNVRAVTDKPMNSTNPVSLCVDLSDGGAATVSNTGYADFDRDFGIYLLTDKLYDFSFYYLADGFDGEISVSVDAMGGAELMSSRLVADITPTSSYSKVKLSGLKPDRSGYGAIKLTVSGKGKLYLDMFSLVATDSFGYDDELWTYSSLRSDLVKTLEDLNPSFVRFPGGCLTEGSFLHEYSYNWKTTLGDLTARKQIPNLWGYNQSMELGFYEYFLLSEHLDAEPIPVLNAGITCQSRRFWTHEGKRAYLEMDTESAEFATLIQDYLDLIEYCNGGVDTYWGAVRAANGHPEPFNLKYVGVGNENWDFPLLDENEKIIGWDEAYFSRFDLIYKAITAAYPNITVISSAGPGSAGAEFTHAWEKIDAFYSDTVVDEHYYAWYDDLAVNFSSRYDSYDRDGAKVFVGEYSANIGGDGNINRNNLDVAVAEGAFLSGVERNGDIVELCAYAPLFGKLNCNQWSPNMIWFEQSEVILTPSYYVQKLFMNNVGDTYLDSSWEGNVEGLYKSVTVDTENDVVIVKIVNNTDSSQTVSVNLSGFDNLNRFANLSYVGSVYGRRVNDRDSHEVYENYDCLKVSKKGRIKYDVGAGSVNVIRIGYGNNDTETKMKPSAGKAAYEYLDKKYDEVNYKIKEIFR